MRTPSDQRIEDRLAGLDSGQPGEAPAAFLSAVRARRSRIVAARSAVVVGCLFLGAAVLLSLPRPTPVAAPAIPAQPIASDDAPSEPVLPASSMLSLRLVWSEQAGSDPASGDWLAAIPAAYAPRPAEAPLRLCDADRLLPSGL